MFHLGHDCSDEEEETELADKSEKGSEDKDESFEGNQLDEDDNDNEADNDNDNEGIVPQSGKNYLESDSYTRYILPKKCPCSNTALYF